MKRTLAVPRFGVVGLAFALTAASPSFGRGTNQYVVQATMKSTAGVLQSAHGSSLTAVLTPVHNDISVGPTFGTEAVITAPAVCTGDLIFANGFDSP